jgi:hypothetical protein
LWHLLLLGKFVKVPFSSERKEARASEERKAVERDPAWSWPYEKLKLP